MCRPCSEAHARNMINDYRTLEAMVTDRQRRLRQEGGRLRSSPSGRRTRSHHRFARLWG